MPYAGGSELLWDRVCCKLDGGKGVDATSDVYESLELGGDGCGGGCASGIRSSDACSSGKSTLSAPSVSSIESPGGDRGAARRMIFAKSGA